MRLHASEGWQSVPSMAAARELVIGDEPAAWERLGFAPGEDGAFALGGLRVRLAGRPAGSGVIELRVDGLAAERPGRAAAGRRRPGPDPAIGSRLLGCRVSPATARSRSTTSSSSPTTATGRPLRSRRPAATSAGAASRPSCRRRWRSSASAELIVEVAAGGRPGALLGRHDRRSPTSTRLAGPLLGAARPAVQPGRRIATVRRAAGLAVALAFMTPRWDSNPPTPADSTSRRRRVAWSDDERPPRPPAEDVPAIAGHESFGRVERTLAPTNDPRGLADGVIHDPVRADRGRASGTALVPRDHHREDPRVERPLRRAAVLGRLEPVARPLARPGVARRALPRRLLALHQRGEAPVRRRASTPPCARPGWSRTGPGRAAAPRARRVPTSRSARRRARARRRRAGRTRTRACARPRRTRPRWSAGCARPSAASSVPSRPPATRAVVRAGRASARVARGARASACRSPSARCASSRRRARRGIVADNEARVRAAVDQAEAAAREPPMRAGRSSSRSAARPARSARAAAARRPARSGDGVGAAGRRRDAEARRRGRARARELAVLVCGEAAADPAELAALRAGGRRPGGARGALGAGRARASGNGPALDAALTARSPPPRSAGATGSERAGYARLRV